MSTLLASLWESPHVSPVQGRRWVDTVEDLDTVDAEMEELIFAMRGLSFRKAATASVPAVAPVLPLVTEEDAPSPLYGPGCDE
jgi:hypothetical protein